MWKVYGDTFMIATRLQRPDATEHPMEPGRVRRPGWLARALARMRQ